jgi:hypothetical protein
MSLPGGLAPDTTADRLVAAGETAAARLADAAGSARSFFGAAFSAVSEKASGLGAPGGAPPPVDTGGVLSEWNQYTASEWKRERGGLRAA